MQRTRFIGGAGLRVTAAYAGKSIDHDLRDSFDALASAEKLPYSKPHPQVYLDCAAKLGVDPLTCVALEDSVNGMIASKAARMRSIVVPAPEAQNDPRFVLANVKLSSLTELTAKDLLG